MDKRNIMVKSNYVIFICIIISLLAMPVLQAEVQTFGIAKKGDCISLPQSYWNSTYTNITKISYPNKTSIRVNYAMDRDSFGNYNYSYCNTNDLGQYIITTTTDVDGIPVNVDYDFEVTNDGTKPDSASGIIYVVVVIISFILFLSALIWCFNTEFKFLKLGLGLGSYILLTWILFILWQLSYNYLNVSGLTNILRLFFIITSIGIFPAFILSFMVILREIYVDIAEKKLLSQGLTWGDR